MHRLSQRLGRLLPSPAVKEKPPHSAAMSSAVTVGRLCCQAVMCTAIGEAISYFPVF